jgi:hypothetical protein
MALPARDPEDPGRDQGGVRIMRYTKFHRILRASASIPVTRDESFVARIVGETDVSTENRFFWIRFRRAIFIASAIAATFALVVFGIFSFRPDYTVTLDVNPSFVMTINRFNRVISLKALDEEAEEVMDGISYYYASPESVLDELKEALIADGYLQEDGIILLGIDGLSSSSDDARIDALTSAFAGVTVICMNQADLASDSVLFKTSYSFYSSFDAIDSEGSTSWDAIVADAYSSRDSYASGETTTGVYTTTAAQWMTTEAQWTTSASESTTAIEDNTGDPAVTQETIYIALDADELEDLATALNVTIAHLRLAIAVFNAYQVYETQSDFEDLVSLPISELASLYAAIP